MSGVVSPVVTCSSAVVTPSVPMLADGCPAIRHSWRTSSTFEVLPLVPVTATIVSGSGAKNFAASRAKARRGSGSAIWTAPSTFASGLATIATAPWRDGVGDIILAVEAAPPEGAEHGARRDLAVVDGEAGDRAAVSLLPVSVAQVHQCPAPLGGPFRRHQVAGRDVAVHVGNDAEQRAGALDHPGDDGGGGPGGGGLAGSGRAVGPRRIDHDDHHIARRIHRESRREGGNVQMTVIAAGLRHGLGRAGLAADAEARNVGVAAGAAHDDRRSSWRIR